MGCQPKHIGFGHIISVLDWTSLKNVITYISNNKCMYQLDFNLFRQYRPLSIRLGPYRPCLRRNMSKHAESQNSSTKFKRVKKVVQWLILTPAWSFELDIKDISIHTHNACIHTYIMYLHALHIHIQACIIFLKTYMHIPMF